MSFDNIFDLTAGVYFYSYNITVCVLIKDIGPRLPFELQPLLLVPGISYMHVRILSKWYAIPGIN